MSSNVSTNPSSAWTTPIVLVVITFLAGAGIRVLASGPQKPASDAATMDDGDMTPESSVNMDDMGDENGNTSTPVADGGMEGAGDHGDHVDPGTDDDDSADPEPEPGPDGTVRIGNKLCPVLGKPVDPDVGVAYNGWWINFCCPGCDDKLLVDPGAYAADLLEQTGHDIHKPAGDAPAMPDLEPGPDGTDSFRVGNTICPVMGNEIDPEVGTVYNGWWINFCCPGCDKKLKADPEAYALNLLEHTGHDIRQRPAAGHAPQFEPGPDGTYRVGNAVCPVMGNEIDPEVGTAFNGWWINFCCPGCDKKFVADPDAYAGTIREQTGIDVRVSPQQLAARPQWKAGPNDTRDLANRICPVSGHEVSGEVGAEINGWWVRVCNPACAGAFVQQLDRFAPALKKQTGIDVRYGPDRQPAPGASDSEDGSGDSMTDGGSSTPGEPGDDGDSERPADLLNETCPVTGNPVDPDHVTLHNGWIIGFCSAGCQRQFADDPGAWADRIRQATGVDIRFTADNQPAPEPEPEPETAADLTPGPDGTFLLGNTLCPVMENPSKVSVGVAYNGWWVTFCCPGCDKDFLENPDAFADFLLENSGHDIRQRPNPSGTADGAADLTPGPDGTFLLGNTLCPVMENPSKESVGVAYNGWWVTFCCPGCDKDFLEDPDAYADFLLENSGHDIRKRPNPSATTDGDGAAGLTSGPDGTVRVGNTTCPVMGDPADADIGVAYNGWWISLCCHDCKADFLDDPEWYAEVVKVETGHDIRQRPPTRPDAPANGSDSDADAGDSARPALPDLPTGPGGTVRLGNKLCPVMGNKTKPEGDVGVAVRGWWVSFCCPMCKREFLGDLDKFADQLLEQTGHDIRQRPR